MSMPGPRREYAPVNGPGIERSESDLEGGTLPNETVPNDVGVRNGAKLTYDLGGFFDQQQLITDDLHRMKGAMSRLERMNEESKVVTLATAVGSLRQRQRVEVESMSVTVGAIHTRLEALVKDNVESSNQAGRGEGSSTYQTRQNVTGALLNKLEKRRKEIFDLEERVVSDGREIIRRRYRFLLGSLPDEPIVDKLSQGGDREKVLKKLNSGGKNSDLGSFGAELTEREELVYGLCAELKKHQQKFLDMSILILEGGMAPDCIGEDLLQSHRSMKHQQSGVGGGKAWGGDRFCVCGRFKWYTLLFLFACLVIVVPVLVIVRPKRSGHL